MRNVDVERRLARLGFEMDWSVVGKDPDSGMWHGTIDPIGRFGYGEGECRGSVVSGATKAEMYRDAIREAEESAPLLEPCDDPDCDMHGGI